MSLISAFFVGLLFGIGLLLSGMTDPGKVQGFLDLFGLWDPSLALVMGGAIAVGVLAFRLAGQRAHTLLGHPMALPVENRIEHRIVVGGLLFGVGWGLAGFCPGPGIVAMAQGEAMGLAFVLAMLAGMAVFEFVDRLNTKPASGGAPA